MAHLQEHPVGKVYQIASVEEEAQSLADVNQNLVGVLVLKEG